MTALPKMIERAKKKFDASDEALADLLRKENVECTARAVFAWRSGARTPEHNAKCWIEQQLRAMLRRRR